MENAKGADLMQQEKKKRHMGWLILGYILVVFTVLLVLGAINNLATSSSNGDAAENFGRIIGTILFPVLVGYFARYCIKKSRN